MVLVYRGLGRPGGDLLSRVLRRSTIGAEGFHGRVRDGIGCITPRNSHQVIQGLCWVSALLWMGVIRGVVFGLSGLGAGVYRCVRRYWLVGIKPIERLVPVSSAHCCASTSGLST